MTTYEPVSKHLERIQRLAAEKWGADVNSYKRPVWEARLVAEYVRLENQTRAEDQQIIANNRRSQIMRAFESGGCTAETLLRLYAAVDCSVKIVQEREV